MLGKPSKSTSDHDYMPGFLTTGLGNIDPAAVSFFNDQIPQTSSLPQHSGLGPTVSSVMDQRRMRVEPQNQKPSPFLRGSEVDAYFKTNSPNPSSAGYPQLSQIQNMQPSAFHSPTTAFQPAAISPSGEHFNMQTRPPPDQKSTTFPRESPFIPNPFYATATSYQPASSPAPNSYQSRGQMIQTMQYNSRYEGVHQQPGSIPLVSPSHSQIVPTADGQTHEQTYGRPSYLPPAPMSFGAANPGTSLYPGHNPSYPPQFGLANLGLPPQMAARSPQMTAADHNQLMRKRRPKDMKALAIARKPIEKPKSKAASKSKAKPKEPTHCSRDLDARSRRLNMAFPKGTFVLRYSDLDVENVQMTSCAIWLIDSYQLIQKFLPDREDVDGRKIYVSTDRYSGWLADEPWLYFPLQNIYALETRDNEAIEVCLPSLPSPHDLDLHKAIEMKKKSEKDEKTGTSLSASHEGGDCAETEGAVTSRSGETIDGEIDNQGSINNPGSSRGYEPTEDQLSMDIHKAFMS